jgi:hypothetical protein
VNEVLGVQVAEFRSVPDQLFHLPEQPPAHAGLRHGFRLGKLSLKEVRRLRGGRWVKAFYIQIKMFT